MEFSGTFELDDATVEKVWLALSDPAMIQHALPGCELLVRVDDEDPDFDALREAHGGDPPELTADPDAIRERAFEEGATYAALVETSVGSVSPSFETVVTIDEREEPYMAASGEGSAGNSSFEMASWMELSATDDGVAVDWNAEADVFGRLAQMGQRMINPVANRMTKRFFGNLQDQLADLEAAAAAETETETEPEAKNETEAETVEETETGTETPTETESEAATGERGTGSGHPDPAADDERTASEGGVGLLARLKRLIGIG